jgi:hypothetical protein
VLSQGFKAEQLKVARLEARIQDLRGSVEDRDERLRAVREDLREAKDQVRAQAKAAPRKPERDDLQSHPRHRPGAREEAAAPGLGTYEGLAALSARRPGERRAQARHEPGHDSQAALDQQCRAPGAREVRRMSERLVSRILPFMLRSRSLAARSR